jgi:LysM repeat protein
VTSFQRTGHRERLFLGAGPRGEGTRVPVPGRAEARALLRDLGRDAWGMAELRRLYAEAMGRASICREGDDAVLDELARQLATGQLWALSVVLEPVPVPYVGDASESAKKSGAGADEDAASPVPAPTKPTWFEVQVLFADTGEPVSSLKLKIKPPSGEEAEHTTNGEGVIRIDGIKKAGDCAVKSDIKGLKRTETLVLAGAPPAAASAGKAKGKAPAYKVAAVNTYKVKTGDTLDKLAKKVGITWKDLAKFNWGTDDPKQINNHLRWDVGCTKKSGKNYVFDDSDDPGTILLPEPLDMAASTGARAVVGVAKLVKAPEWIFSV